MFKLIRLFAIVAAFAGLAMQGAYGQVLYAADGQGGIPGNLYIINPATGAVVQTIGPIGFGVTGLAFHPGTGVLYGTTGAELAPAALIRINTATGAGTLIGNNTNGPIADITFRADGTLFGWTEDTDDLVTVNIATGVETVVSDSGIGTAGSGIAFSPGGTLFYAGNNSNGALRTVNPATGLTTVAVTMTGGPPSNRVNALAFNAAGTLYGSVKQSPGDTLVTINTTTGVVTTIGALPPGIDAIVFAPAAAAGVQAVPTLSQWAVVALGLLIAGSLLLMRRRV
jgi:DNA-binding beta-propeller fold protein YncE